MALRRFLGTGLSRSPLRVAELHTTPACYAEAAVAVKTAVKKPECAAAKRRRLFWNLMVEDTTPPNETVQKMYDGMLETLAKGSTFPKADLFEMFHACKTRADVNVCLKLLDRLHKFRAARLRVFKRFNPDVSELVAKIACRINEPLYALKLLTKFNKFGLSPDIKASHQILEHATETLNTRLSFTVLRHMRRNTIRPTADTAHIIIKQCMKMKRAAPQIGLAKEFHLNEIELHPVTYDMCLVSAANSGRAQDVFDIQRCKEHYNVPHTPSSVFSLAKAHLLKKKPEEAARLIFDECKDEEVLRKYLKSMVRLWPVQLVTSHTGSKKSAKHSMNTLKEMQVEMLKSLKKLGVRMDMDLEQNFGAAKGEGDKYEFCFGGTDK